MKNILYFIITMIFLLINKKYNNMKKTIITIAFFAVLAGIPVSCQKENVIEETSIVSENRVVYTMRYTIDGVTHSITLIGDEAWRDFLNRMFALAEEGHSVSFCEESNSNRIVSVKDVVTYTTNNREEAYSWADRMIEQGYTVTIKYDKENGKYTCTAIN